MMKTVILIVLIIFSLLASGKADAEGERERFPLGGCHSN